MLRARRARRADLRNWGICAVSGWTLRLWAARCSRVEPPFGPNRGEDTVGAFGTDHTPDHVGWSNPNHHARSEFKGGRHHLGRSRKACCFVLDKWPQM